MTNTNTTGKIFFLDSDVLISYDGFELDKARIKAMTLANKRWTRQLIQVYATIKVTYFEKEFMEGAMNRWEEIKLHRYTS